MKTRLCELLGIEYPIIQGGMAWVATAELAAAVSNGGGIGLIAAGNAPADVVRAQIQKAKSLTDKPFGVNVMMMSPFVEEVMQVIIEEKPAVVATGAGNPGKYIASLKEAGIKIMPVVASVAMANQIRSPKWKKTVQTQLSQRVQKQADISVSLQQWYLYRRLLTR